MKFVHLKSEAGESEVGTFTKHIYTVRKDDRLHTVKLIDESDDITVMLADFDDVSYRLKEDELIDAAEEFIKENFDQIRSMKLDKNIASPQEEEKKLDIPWWVRHNPKTKAWAGYLDGKEFAEIVAIADGTYAVFISGEFHKDKFPTWEDAEDEAILQLNK